MTVAFDRQRSVPKQVYELLREKIVTVELKPGESINERFLADWLGISRTPIREAIKRLSEEGLIRTVPNVGTRVSRISARKTAELCIIRASLESAAIRAAAVRFDEATRAVLADAIERQKEAAGAMDLKRYVAVDNEFHQAIVRLSGFTTLSSILHTIMGDNMRVRHLSMRVPARLQGPIRGHQEVLAALATRDPEIADAALRHHLDAAYKLAMQAIADHPDYIDDEPVSPRELQVPGAFYR